MAAKAHPPAWYPDPHHPGRLRRWDGRTWTHEVRPFPDWLRTLRLAPGPGPGRHRPGRWMWLASAALLGAGGLLMLGLGLTSRPGPDHITDPSFRLAANTLCRQARDPVGAGDQGGEDPGPGTGGTAAADPAGDGPGEGGAPGRAAEPGGEADRARHDAEVAERVARELRAVDVDGDDRGTVERWLAGWDDYAQLAREHARALRAGGGAESDDVAERRARARRGIDLVSTANGLDECAEP